MATLRLAAEHADTMLRAVRREYPNSPRHIMTDATDQVTPRDAHPAFYGCYDWHSAIELHWALVVLLRSLPEEVPVDEITAVFDAHLTAENIAAEVAYLAAHPGWERPYGWGWALQLAGELRDWASTGDADAIRWAAAVRPLAEHITTELLDWLPRLTYPDRSGTHGNTAFTLARAVEWPDARLRRVVDETARRLYLGDTAYPVAYEPSGADFLSPFFTGAVLMSEILDAEEFGPWWAAYAPADLPELLVRPATVETPADGPGSHLHGLNLYRMRALRRLLPHVTGAQRRLFDAGLQAHEATARAALEDPGWPTEHWIGAFAVLAFR